MMTKSKLLSFLVMLLWNQRGEIDNPLGGDDKDDDKGGDDKGGKVDDKDDDKGGDDKDKKVSIKWPEGLEDSIKESEMLKPFIKKDGDLNYASLLNAYYHTKKMVGKDKVVIPGENATDEEKADFFKKLGWTDDKEAYVVEKMENSLLDDKFVGKLKDWAQENNIPIKTAQKLVSFMDEQTVELNGAEEAKIVESIENGLLGLKKEWGQSYEGNRYAARKVLHELIDDPEVTAAFKDPRLGANPAVLKAFAKVAGKVYGEDVFKGDPQYQGILSPAQAQERIDAIYADKDHAYHRGDEKATQEMLKLRDML